VPSAPGAVARSEEPKYGGVIITAIRGDPPGWDPMYIRTAHQVQVVAAVMSNGNLVKPCPENIYKICPGVAESWEANGDFTEWTFKIRDNVNWHDGTAFTPDDAKFWMELAFYGATVGGKERRPAWFKVDLGDLKKVDTLPGNRLKVTLGQPAPLYPFTLGQFWYNISHPRHLTKPLIEKGQVGVGPQDVGFVATGPFKLTSYSKGIGVKARRFEGYWEKDNNGRRLPFLDGIDFPIIPDPAAMDAAFRVGRLDGTARGDDFYLTEGRKVGYARDLGDKVWFAEIGGSRRAYGFNTLKGGPWQDVRVRKAISLWIDRQAAAKVEEFGQVATLLDPQNPFTSPDFLTWPGYNAATKARDRTEAKRLMSEAGYPSGFKMTLPCRKVWLDQCEFIAAQFGGLGIDVRILTLETATWQERRFTLDFDFQIGGASFSTTPEQTEVEISVYSVAPVAGAKYEDPKIPEFYRKLGRNSNFDQRVAIWREMERYFLLDQAYFVATAMNMQVIAFRSYVKGVIAPAENGNNNTALATTWLDR
jgi:peptide/nickel transport system substrate-binding protein